MKRGRKLLKVSIALLILCEGCSSSSGGANGTGGTPGAGGKQGTGNGGSSGGAGAIGNGGAPGAGGGQGSGGAGVGSGGRSGSGGVPGTGGTVTADAGRPPVADAGRPPVTDAGRPGTGGASGSGGSVGPGIDGGAASSGGAGATSAGCGSANTTSACAVKGTTCSLDVSGTSRTYYVQLPKDYSAAKPYPLIFQFHPWGGSADQALTMYGLNTSSGIPEAIYVTPQGLQAGSNGAGWANTNGQDIAFTKAMLADVQGKYCVDNARIFSVGFSYGGMMSFAIACEMSDVFRAIAPMSGALYSDFNCKGTGPHIAMWGSHGLNDTVVPIDDGRAARDKVLQQNHCGTTTTPVDPSPCVKYQGCDPGYDVTWCEWDGPHGIPSFGSSAIIAFLKQF